MLGKGEKKRSKSGGAIVGALAAVGFISIFKKGKRFAKNMGQKIKSMFKGNGECDTE